MLVVDSDLLSSLCFGTKINVECTPQRYKGLEFSPTNGKSSVVIDVHVCAAPQKHDSNVKSADNKNPGVPCMPTIEYEMYYDHFQLATLLNHWYQSDEKRIAKELQSAGTLLNCAPNETVYISHGTLARRAYNETSVGSALYPSWDNSLTRVCFVDYMSKLWMQHWQELRPAQFLLPEEQGLVGDVESHLLSHLRLQNLERRYLEDPFRLKRHQLDGIEWMWMREQLMYFGVSGGILADEMGLGKTLQALMLILAHRSCSGTRANLIVCKLSVLHQWRAEAHKFLADKNVSTSETDDVFLLKDGGKMQMHIAHASSGTGTWSILPSDTGDDHDDEDPEGKEGGSEYDSSILLVLTTYDTLRNKVKQFQDIHWHRVVCDEGHHIANHNSGTLKALASLRGQHKWILSGSPYRNSPRDLYSQMVDFLGLRDKALYEERFGVKARWNRIFTRNDALVEWRDYEDMSKLPKYNCNAMSPRDSGLIEMWMNSLLLRRTNDQWLKETIPKRHDEYHHIKLGQCDPREEAVYNLIRDIVKDYVLSIEESNQTLDFVSVHGGVLLMRRICVAADLLLTTEEDEETMFENNGDGNLSGRVLRKEHVLRALPPKLKAWIADKARDSALSSKRPVVTGSSSKLERLVEVLRNIFTVYPADRNNGMWSRKREMPENGDSDPVLKREQTTGSSLPRVVIFSQWNGGLDKADVCVKEASGYRKFVQIRRIDGSTNGTDRQRHIKWFNDQQEDSDESSEGCIKVILVNYKAAGEGINLHNGDTVILLDPWFTPSVEDQAIARVLRQGNQREWVTVHHLLVAESIENRVKEISERKRRESKSLLQHGIVISQDTRRINKSKATFDLSFDTVRSLLG
eukprot:Clim_evm2s54 gene=Clim_evmTU2s54